MRKIERREFIKLVGGVIGTEIFRPIAPFSPDVPEKPQPEAFPFQEILNRYPHINSKITAVNLSCIPDRVSGQYAGFHHPEESLVMAVPYREIEKGELKIDGYASGLKEAIGRGQKVTLVVEIPYKPEEYNTQFWTRSIERITEYFQGASALIIGNEINTPHSPWENCLDIYQELYLIAYQKIKTISPRSLVFPWQEVLYGQGEILQEFLSKGNPIDGLAINFYGLSKEIEGRVDLYQQILEQFGYSHLPVIISELGKPGFKPTHEQQARLVVQNLAMAAYLEKQGKINLSAWYCAYSGPNNEHALSFSNDKEFVPKPGLFAFLLCQRLLIGDIDLIKNPSGLVQVVVSSRNRPKACFVWNEGEEKIVVFPKPGCHRVWKPTGEKLFPYFPIVFRPSSNPSVFPGETAIFTFQPTSRQHLKSNI